MLSINELKSKALAKRGYRKDVINTAMKNLKAKESELLEKIIPLNSDLECYARSNNLKCQYDESKLFFYDEEGVKIVYSNGRFNIDDPDLKQLAVYYQNALPDLIELNKVRNDMIVVKGEKLVEAFQHEDIESASNRAKRRGYEKNKRDIISEIRDATDGFICLNDYMFGDIDVDRHITTAIYYKDDEWLPYSKDRDTRNNEQAIIDDNKNLLNKYIEQLEKINGVTRDDESLRRNIENQRMTRHRVIAEYVPVLQEERKIVK